MDVSPTQIRADLRRTFRGRLLFDDVSRGLYAIDASPFQVTPAGVAVPADADDLATLVRYCHEHAVPMVPRGAGTGVAGESLGPGLVVDLSPHFRAIADVAHDTVTAEAAVTHAELNTALARHGRRFAPDPASGASCTVGGMVATDASGGNAFRHGYTRDYVRALDVVWDNGETSTVHRPSSIDKCPEGVEPWTVDRGQRTSEIAAAVGQLLGEHRELIHLTRPLTRFNRCGYVLHDALTDAGPDLVRLLVGSEGTLGFVTRATLRTIPLAGGRAVCLLGFATVDAALKAGIELRTASPVGCDLLDRRLLSVGRAGRGADGAGLVPPSVGAALVVYFEADTEAAAVEDARRAVNAVRANHRVGVLAEPTAHPDGVRRVQAVREAAVSGLYALGRGPRPVAGVEDVAVPPEALPEFVAQTQAAVRRFDLTASFLVHTLTGQVHTRPLVDLDDRTDRAKLWPLAEAVHGLALAVGGTVSGQHGTGIARTPWVEKQYGPLLPVFRELKRVFDPKGLLNPGKIVGPDPSRPAWPLRAMSGDAPAEPPPDALADSEE